MSLVRPPHPLATADARRPAGRADPAGPRHRRHRARASRRSPAGRRSSWAAARWSPRSPSARSCSHPGRRPRTSPWATSSASGSARSSPSSPTASCGSSTRGRRPLDRDQGRRQRGRRPVDHPGHRGHRRGLEVDHPLRRLRRPPAEHRTRRPVPPRARDPRARRRVAPREPRAGRRSSSPARRPGRARCWRRDDLRTRVRRGSRRVRRRRGVALLVGAVLAVGALGAAPVTLARFRAGVDRAGTFGTATLLPPTNLAGHRRRRPRRSRGPRRPARGRPATGVLRSATSGSGYGQVASGHAGHRDGHDRQPRPPAPGTTSCGRSSTTGRASDSNEASVVVAPATTTTGAVQCTARANAAETTNAGDNNGYERSPGSACAVDGRVATDADTGTSDTNSCTANTKDKHRFWGYAFGLPGDGHVDQRDHGPAPSAGMNNNGGTTWLCVQLSADAGATWTTPKSAVLGATALTAYTPGRRDRPVGPRRGRSRSSAPAQLPGPGDRLARPSRTSSSGSTRSRWR